MSSRFSRARGSFACTASAPIGSPSTPPGRSRPRSLSSSPTDRGCREVLEEYRATPEPPHKDPGRDDLNEDQGRKKRRMLHDRGERARPGKHQRQVYHIEDDNPDQQTSRTAKDFPAGDAERELHDEIEKGVALQIQAESRSPRQWQQSDVRLVLNDVE